MAASPATANTGPGANLEPGDLVKDRWKVIKSIGKGAFGEIFQAEDLETGVHVAVKTEKLDSKKRVLKIEVAVLKKLQACPFVCRYQQFGRHEEFHFVVMELLGENLSVLRKKQPGKRFSVGTTMRLGMQMVRAIEGMHEHGYLHRDIKPSNFAMGRQPENRDWCFLIDFGLARRYQLPHGEIRTARESAGFRGTARYASINSHLSKELARRDDMWSLLYMIIEFLKGSLPWSNIENKEDVGRRKIELDSLDLVAGLPVEMGNFMEHLRTLDYKDKPNYDYITDLFNQIMEKANVTEDEPYDWEVKDSLPSTPPQNNTQSRRGAPSSAMRGEASMDNQSPADDRLQGNKARRNGTGGTSARRPKAEPQQLMDTRGAKTKRTGRTKRSEAPAADAPLEPDSAQAQRVSPHETNSSPPATTSEKPQSQDQGGDPAKEENPAGGPDQGRGSKENSETGGGCRCVIA